MKTELLATELFEMNAKSERDTAVGDRSTKSQTSACESFWQYCTFSYFFVMIKTEQNIRNQVFKKSFREAVVCFLTEELSICSFSCFFANQFACLQIVEKARN